MSALPSSLRLFAAGVALSAALSAQITPVPPPTPPAYVPGPVTHIASPGMVTVVATGQTFTQYTFCGTGPIQNAVAYAINFVMQAGDCLGVTGGHPGITFVPVKNLCHQGEISWGMGDVVHDVDIVALDSTASIDGVFVIGDYTTLNGGGVDRITFQGITLRNPPGSFAPFQTTNNGRQGLIRLYRCVFDAIDPTGWGGKGKKFDVRAYLLTLDARGCTSVYGAQEHNFYVDSVGYDEAYPYGMILEKNRTLGTTGRTGLQMVNRINPAGGSYVGAPGKGLVLVRENTFWTDASAGGGSAITVAGHWGDVWVEDNHVTADGGGGGSVDSGGMVAWSPGGTWLLPSGHANGRVFVNDNLFTGTGTRPNVSAAGCRVVWIDQNTFQMPGHGVVLDGVLGSGGGSNGAEFLPPSMMAGWQQGGCKAVDGACLTDQQIDTLY